jgi:hypothetical protein
MSKVYDRQCHEDETTAVHADEETVKRKASLRGINDRHELMPIHEIGKKSSLKIAREPSRQEKTSKEKSEKPSDTKLNISKSLQSTRTSNSSLRRSTRKREVRRGLVGGL